MRTLIYLIILNCFAVFAGEHAEPVVFSDITAITTKSSPEDASYLAETLQKIYGRKFTAGSDLTGAIAIGTPEDFPALTLKLSNPQSYAIITHPKGIYLVGNSPQACSYAVSDLLHELGYRRFFPSANWEIIPAVPPATLTLHKSESPDYESRNIMPGWGLWPEYRGQDQGHALWHRQNRTGGTDMSTGHVYGAFIRQKQDEFNRHPEYYALVKGKRDGNKLCISNPGLRELFAQYSLEILRRYPQRSSVSAEPSDGGNWCECDPCAQIGTPSDRVVLLANSTAEALSREFPNARVGFYAYNLHSPPPTLKVHPNVVANIATSFIRHGWTLEQLISGWQQQGARIGIREYYFAGPAPGVGRAANPKLIASTIKDFYRQNARYMRAESTDAWGPGGLSYYAAARLLWDTTLELRDIEDDFFSRAFPASEKEMRQFYTLLDGSSRRPLNHDLLGRMYRSLAAARPLATGGERRRIDELICYTRFNELLLALQTTPNATTYEALLNYASAIKPFFLIHSYAMFRDERALRPTGLKGTPAKNIDWKNQPLPQDLDAVLTAGIANNKLMDFEPLEFDDNLRPAIFRGTNKYEQPGMMRGHRKFLLWSNAKPIQLTLTGGFVYQNRGNLKITLIQLGGTSDTGELETIIQHDESVPSDKNEHSITLIPRHPGLHRLEINDGSAGTTVRFPENLAVSIPIETESAPSISGNFYFYVPKGTTLLGFYAQAKRGRLIHPGGGKEGYNLAGHNGFYRIAVPVGQDGTIWRVQSLSGTIKLLTVPSALSLNSHRLLIPESIIIKDKL